MAWPWSRLNTVLLLAVLLLLIAMFATRAYGGPLDPPGPPGSTDGVRTAGTPITSLPITIAQPGYYYVTRELTGTTGQDGITITTSNVTVDLGGFRLLGGASPGDGIVLSGGLRNITIRNGSIRGWNDGVDLIAAQFSVVDGVQSSSNSGRGFVISGRSTLSNCNASLNGNVGIQVDVGVVRDCIVSENSAGGMNVQAYALVEGNYIAANALFPGMTVGNFNTIRDNVVVQNPSASGNLEVAGNNNFVTGNTYCTLNDTGSDNFYLGNSGNLGC